MDAPSGMIFSLSTSTDSTQRTTSRYPPSVHSPAGRPIPALKLLLRPVPTVQPTHPARPPVQLLILPKSTSSVLRVVIVDIPRSVIHPLLVGPWPPSTRAVRNPEIHPPTRRLGPRAVPPHPLFSSRQHVPPVSHAKCAVTSAQATTHPPPRPPDLTPPIPITAPYHLGGPLL